MIHIATIITCYNRKEKTISSLRHMYAAQEYYNSTSKEKIDIVLYMTDDGCTDGTSEAVQNTFPNKKIHIQKSNGDLFWARGMNFSWKVAAKDREWDYYLLLNDDTDMTVDCFNQLFEAEQYSIGHHEKEALVGGIIASKENRNEIIYGGESFLTKFTAKLQLVFPSGKPQQCDLLNANIMFVPKSIFQRIGIFYPYRHGCADSDYSAMAKRAGFLVFVTSGICGYCDFDHWTKADDKVNIVKMTLQERKAYFNHPLHSNKDYLTLIRRITPWRYPFVWLFRNMVVYCPSLYYKITFRRYKK